MVEEIVRKAEEAADDIRLLDDRKMSLSWAGVKGFMRELVSDGLVPALVFGAVGAAIAAVGITTGAVISTELALAELVPVIGYTAGAAATAAAGFIGARGAIEDINIARKTNAEIDRAIGIVEKEGLSSSKDASGKDNLPFVNVTGGISMDKAPENKPSTSISTRDAMITSIADGLEKLSDKTISSLHR